MPSDTRATDIVETTIKLDKIADLFRSTSARVAICVLDCCFSGAAPARVFEDSPAYRSAVFPLANIEGDGKIFITASRANEPALEHPNGGHGLLTQALINALESSNNDRVDLMASMSNITEEVRAAASKYGEQQNPVFFGQMEGGLYLPRLTRGSNYYTHFPDAHGTFVSKDIAELEAFSIPKSIIDEWASRYAGGLNQLQLDAVNIYRILEEESLLVVAPTSSGKTFIGEMAAAHAISLGKKAVFLLPYRALVNEKFDEFNALYGTQLGMRVIRCTGDYTDDITLWFFRTSRGEQKFQ
jgi:helicase